MKSPFFWQDAGLLLLLVANFAFSVWLVVRTPDDTRVENVASAASTERKGMPKTPLVWRILLRALCLVYATASCLTLFVLALQFRDTEFLPTSQEYWRQRNSYPQVKMGMTQKQVDEIMGDLRDVWHRNDNEQYHYLLSPSGLPENATVSFGADPKNAGGAVVVIDKWPDDKRLNVLNHWWRGHLLFEYWRCDAVLDKAMGLSCMGMLLLAVVSLLPFWPCRDWRSLALYFPVAALTLGLAHEFTRRGDLRWVVFLIAPSSVVIVVTWVIRVILVARK